MSSKNFQFDSAGFLDLPGKSQTFALVKFASLKWIMLLLLLLLIELFYVLRYHRHGLDYLIITIIRWF